MSVAESKLKENTTRNCEGLENIPERVTIGFGFISDWMKKWREIV